MTERKLLKRAISLVESTLKFFGPNGEKWHKGDLTDFQGSYCIYGGISRKNPNSLVETKVIDTADSIVLKYPKHWVSIIDLNDAPNTRFRHIKNVLLKTKKQLELELAAI